MSIRFHQVSKSFGSLAVLQEVSFEVKQSEILFILGKSGVGKSVTLKHITGMMKPDRGSVTIDHQEISTLNSRALSVIRKKCGMVFQQPALFDSLTVFENVAFGLNKTTLSKERIRRIVIETLGWVHLGEDVLSRYPVELSFGMQKRVSLARTLAPGPKYLLFDEPTTGLDPITSRAINRLISDLSRHLHVTSLVVSHDMIGALEVADRILVLDRGSVVAHGTVNEIKNSTEPLVREFLKDVL